jgi:hypothetical protein
MSRIRHALATKQDEFIVATGTFIVAMLGYYYHDRFFKWADQSEECYWAFARLSFGMVLCGGFFLAAPRLRLVRLLQSRLSFAVWLGLALIAFRWPSVVLNRQFSDPDESQLLAGAITLTHDPLFFRSVDGTTHGPLDQYILTLPHWFGLPIDYLTGRSVMLFLNWVTIVAGWLGLGTFLPERMARLSVLGALAFYGLSTADAINQCGTEDLPAALLMLAFCLLCFGWRALQQSRRATWTLLGAGLCLGAIPFAKLQGSLPALALGLTAIVSLATAGLERRVKIIHLTALVIGALAPSVLLMGIFAAVGIFPDFWQAYILGNFAYAQEKHHSSGWILRNFFPYAAGTGARWFFYASTWVMAVSAPALVKTPRAWRVPLALLYACALFSLAAAVTPGRVYPHYLRLLIVPFAALTGALAAVAATLAEVQRFAWGPAGVAGILAAATLYPQFNERHERVDAFQYGHYRTQRKILPSSPAQLVLQYTRPDESLAMWGWEPRIYVETQLRQATREAHTVRQVEVTPQREYYRQRFLQDFTAAHPPVFVDAVGPGNFIMQDRAVLGHETLPELHALIVRNYTLISDLEGFRVYVRNDRAHASRVSQVQVP